MEWIIGGVILLAILGAFSQKKKCRYCGKELASGESEDKCPERYRSYSSSSSRGFDPTPRTCKGCGKSFIDLTTCPACGTFNRAP